MPQNNALRGAYCPAWILARASHRARQSCQPDCTMMITEPNEFVAEVHDRMPVLLTEKDFEPWLSGNAGVELLRPAPNDLLQRWPVSRRVSSSKAPAEDATLIDPIAI
jgi:putative SOS response-associated peptidase YedK